MNDRILSDKDALNRVLTLEREILTKSSYLNQRMYSEQIEAWFQPENPEVFH